MKMPQLTRRPDRPEQQLLALWAADCAARVLPYFETVCPEDSRPREAVEGARAWARGEWVYKDVHKAALAAHAAARDVSALPEGAGAVPAARAAGHAVATGHVARHAFGAPWYALKAIRAVGGEAAALAEEEWQWAHFPEQLRMLVSRT